MQLTSGRLIRREGCLVWRLPCGPLCTLSAVYRNWPPVFPDLEVALAVPHDWISKPFHKAWGADVRGETAWRLSRQTFPSTAAVFFTALLQ